MASTSIGNIVREIGGRLRSTIKEEPALPPVLRLQLARFRKSEANHEPGHKSCA